MSYILDALNKSEQERKKQQAPDLATVHRRQKESASKNRWLPILVLITMINLAAIAYWQLNQAPATTSGTAASVPTGHGVTTASPQSNPVTNSQSVDDKKITPATVMPMPVETSQTLSQQPVTTHKLEPGEVLVTPGNFGDRNELQSVKPVRVSELPVNIQRQIPDLKFSSHLYSNDFRMVNINGKMTREGDTIAQGLKLVEITEEGVVLSYLHYTFEMSVLRDWAFD